MSDKTDFKELLTQLSPNDEEQLLYILEERLNRRHVPDPSLDFMDLQDPPIQNVSCWLEIEERDFPFVFSRLAEQFKLSLKDARRSTHELWHLEYEETKGAAGEHKTGQLPIFELNFGPPYKWGEYLTLVRKLFAAYLDKTDRKPPRAIGLTYIDRILLNIDDCELGSYFTVAPPLGSSLSWLKKFGSLNYASRSTKLEYAYEIPVCFDNFQCVQGYYFMRVNNGFQIVLEAYAPNVQQLCDPRLARSRDSALQEMLHILKLLRCLNYLAFHNSIRDATRRSLWSYIPSAI